MNNKNYDHELKMRMRKKNFFMNNKKNIVDIKKTKEKSLTKMIVLLDDNIQKKIYIYAMKEYWKYILLNKPLLSLTDKYNIYLKKELSKTLLNNIHFLHLDFNCKPGYKEYISGCQCSFCKGFSKEEKDQGYVNIMNGEDPYFNCESLYKYSENTLPLNWFYENIDESSYITYFDFLKGSYEDPIRTCPHESPQYFSCEFKSKI